MIGLVRIILLGFATISLCKSATSNDTNTFPPYLSLNQENVFDWVKKATIQHSPDSWNLLMLYENLPQSNSAKGVNGSTISSTKSVSTFYYLKGESRYELLNSMSTNVHEIAHAYFSQSIYNFSNNSNVLLNFDNAELNFYLSPNELYFVSFPKTMLFPARELASIIPEKLRTYRFDTYINGNTSTQINGIIGLLNELFAYNLGSKFTFEMLEAYKTAEDSESEGFLKWVMHSQSSISAFYEFDFFIKEYLLYMKSNYSTNYQQLIKNKSFVNAYLKVNAAFVMLTESYQ
ncbi:MAG TPA: hypothetical protein P5200_11685, partial [Tenuifilaceae bacterium]|nr:hypothetical protein [Tenuifilaceae bacterium]